VTYLRNSPRPSSPNNNVPCLEVLKENFVCAGAPRSTALGGFAVLLSVPYKEKEYMQSTEYECEAVLMPLTKYASTLLKV
jgi:hypothetical protein